MSRIALLLTVVVCFTSGCAMLTPSYRAAPAVPAEPALADYEQVPFKKISSGLYRDELVGHFLRTECQYSSMMTNSMGQAYPSSPGRVQFAVVQPGYGASVDQRTAMQSPEWVLVEADSAMKDRIYELEDGQKIILYAYCQNYRVHGYDMKRLQLVAKKIEIPGLDTPVGQ